MLEAMTMKLENVRLRKFRISDISKLYELANNEKVSENLRDAFPNPYTLKDAEAFIKNCLKQDPVLTFAIEYSEEYVGNIGLIPGQDVYRGSAEIGYFIGEQYWNKGITTKAVRILTDYGFSELDIVRIHTGIFEYNTASMKVLENCGYSKDCIFKKSVFKKGRIWDEHRYSIINPKYE